MNKDRKKGLQRLIVIRDLERDIAKGKSAEAAARLANSSRSREDAARELESESQDLNDNSRPREISELQMVRESVTYAQRNLAKTVVDEQAALLGHNAAFAHLIETHKRIKQMEQLLAEVDQSVTRMENAQEQKSMDDLSVTMLGHRQ